MHGHVDIGEDVAEAEVLAEVEDVVGHSHLTAEGAIRATSHHQVSLEVGHARAIAQDQR